MNTDNDRSSVDRLCKKLGRPFTAILRSRTETDRMLERLRDLARDPGIGNAPGLRLPPPDSSIVLLGSLARAEWTSGSDIDWTILIDGAADTQHKDAEREFKRRIDEAKLQPPSPVGAFAGLAFSHEMIHRIGGENDTNANTTRRILLLLESVSLCETVGAHSRVLRGILKRYIESERSFLAESGLRYKVPRFLLNDIVRYWRTMAVDYVSKQWERGNRGWALRNIKLRFSRKLTFVSGMLSCFGSYLQSKASSDSPLLRDREQAQRAVQQHLTSQFGRPPMEILCEHLVGRSPPETSVQIMEAYDGFLTALNDSDRRKHLENLPMEAAYQDGVFQEMRKLSQSFQKGLDRMFYDDDPDLQGLIRKYGVF